MAERDTNEAISVKAALSGDGDAFAALVRRHTGAVYQFAYRYVRTGADAEDITQEAFVRAWRNLRKYDTSKNFRTWLFAIAKNAALDAIKKKKPFLFSQIAAEEGALDALLAPYLGSGEFLDAAFDQKMTKADLASMLRTLPAAYRTVLVMRYEESLKFREIAAALGEPIDTVKSRHRRGLMLLRKLVADRQEGASFA